MIVMGLISGTSADGIDAALCEIVGAPPHLDVRVLHALTIPYEPSLRTRILHTCTLEGGRIDHITLLNAHIGAAFGDAAVMLMSAAEIRPAAVDLIASHGQTVWHAVDSTGRAQATLQLGDAAYIAERTGITTVSDFRPRDIVVGGQGAPLTAYADWLLLRHPTRWRAVQNIGGIGNVTFLPPHDDMTPPLAFDTGPGNVLIDSAVALLTDGAQTYDHDGMIAADGDIDDILIAYWLDDPYFERTPPKTTGRELYTVEMARDIVKSGAARGLRTADIIATLTAFTARSIRDAYQRFAPHPVQEVIVGGGGARNPTLMRWLSEELAPARVFTHEDVGMDSDSKEAMVLALLGYETWHHRPGNFPAVTGARKSVVLGTITPGQNYLDLIHRTWG